MLIEDKINSFRLLETLGVYTDKTEKEKQTPGSLVSLAQRSISHEQLNLVKDKEKMHTDDSADQNSRRPTVTASERKTSQRMKEEEEEEEK
jgi:hypothetical protein